MVHAARVSATKLELTDRALDRLREITPDGTVAKIDVSLTDDRGLAYAIVLIRAVLEASAAD